MITANDFRRIALGLEGAVEGAHMGHPDFRVNGRIFATLHADQRFGMVKLTPDQQREFLGRDPASFAPESGSWGRAGSTRVTLGRADDETLGEAMTLAWRNATGHQAREPRVRRRSPARSSSGKKRSR